MNAIFSRYLNATVLVVWGSLLAYFYFSGRIASYLHPSFHLFTAAAGIALILLAACVLFGGEFADACGVPDCGHAAPKSLPAHLIASIFLIVPLLLATASSLDQFGASTVLNRGLVSTAAQLPARAAKPAPPQPAANAPASNADSAGPEIVDLVYAAEDNDARASLEGKSVDLIGQYMPAKTNNPQGNRFNLVRMLIVCCAADARPVSVTVQMPKLKDIPEMSWVRLSGHATFPIESGHRIPIVQADSVKITDPPDDSFIY